MADYPDWVLAHKKKGTYINYVKGKYYLYAAHSERVPGTKKVRRVSDGYIGRITEKDGLIPAKDKVDGAIVVYEYGLHMTALVVSGDILTGLRREFRAVATRIYISGILLATGGEADDESFKSSYLSVVFPGVSVVQALSDSQRTGLGRCQRMVADKLSGVIGDGHMKAKLSRVHMVVVNGKEYLSGRPPDVEAWLNKHNIEWGAPTNDKKQRGNTRYPKSDR